LTKTGAALVLVCCAVVGDGKENPKNILNTFVRLIKKGRERDSAG
jgi:hypothetical protein